MTDQAVRALPAETINALLGPLPRAELGRILREQGAGHDFEDAEIDARIAALDREGETLARAYDLEKSRWSDIVLTRLSDGQFEDLADPGPEDADWDRRVVVILRASPEREGGRRAALAEEHGLKDGCMDAPVRRATPLHELRRRGCHPRRFPRSKGRSSGFGIEMVDEGAVRRWLGRG